MSAKLPIFCRRLVKLRKERGASLSIAASWIGCTKAHLWDLEKGHSRNPSLAILQGAAKYYDTTVGYLIGESAT